MKDKQIGTANSYELGLKNEAMMFNHSADLCQVMGDFENEKILRFKAKKILSHYHAIKCKREKYLLKLEEVLTDIQLNLF